MVFTPCQAEILLYGVEIRVLVGGIFRAYSTKGFGRRKIKNPGNPVFCIPFDSFVVTEYCLLYNVSK